MIADWTVEIGHESPEIVVPWDGWVNLTRPDLGQADLTRPDLTQADLPRNDGGRPDFAGIELIAEASEYPELLPLLALANNAATLSSKVDVFAVTREEVDPEIAEAGLARTACGLGSYLDVLFKRPASPTSFGPFEQLAREIVRLLERVDLPLACAEVVVRPARLYDEKTFGLTLYSMGFGPDAQAARSVWQRAATAGVACLHESLRSIRYSGE